MLKILASKGIDSDQVVSGLSRSFPQVKFKIYRSDDSKSFITCFVSIFNSAAECLIQWESVNSAVAMSAQGIMHGYDAPWNLYLIIVTPDQLTKDAKYRIENNRFAARKITILSTDLPEDGTDRYRILIENVILGNDLHLLKKKTHVSNTKTFEDTDIKKFILSQTGIIPPDRKPTSSALRKKYINDLLNLTTKS
jgi:hypothetical protein